MRRGTEGVVVSEDWIHLSGELSHSQLAGDMSTPMQWSHERQGARHAVGRCVVNDRSTEPICVQGYSERTVEARNCLLKHVNIQTTGRRRGKAHWYSAWPAVGVRYGDVPARRRSGC